MSRRLLLVAGGGLARETAESLVAAGGTELVGVLDDDAELVGSMVAGARVLGPVESVVDVPDAKVLVCAGRGQSRRALVGRLEAAGVTDGRWATSVHPAAAIPGSVRIGPGAIVLAGVVMTADVGLGRHVVVMPNVVLTHDDVVEDFATLAAGVVLGGGVTVGQHAYLGMGCSVREGCSIGRDAVVGMGAVVLSDVPAGQTWAGVPARPLPAAESLRR